MSRWLAMFRAITWPIVFAFFVLVCEIIPLLALYLFFSGGCR